MQESFFRTFQRYLRAKLSIFYNKQEIQTNEIKILITEIHKLCDFIFKYKKNSRKKTHKIFSKKILSLVKNGDFLNFLQRSFIQQMFFIHNRFYLLYYLLELKKTKKWKFWKKVLKESSVGNPVRYFLYPWTSGNKIFQAYHLKQYEDFSKINLKAYDVIVEFGGGYGNMACMFKKINPSVKYIIFDTFEVNLLQFYYLKRNKVNVAFGHSYRQTNYVHLYHSIKKLKLKIESFEKKSKKLLIANWSLSEIPVKLRNNMFFLFREFDYQLISFQKQFENIDNYKYFSGILNYNNQKKRLSKIKKIIKKNNHFYLFSKKIN